jgi:hypothetical protein
MPMAQPLRAPWFALRRTRGARWASRSHGSFGRPILGFLARGPDIGEGGALPSGSQGPRPAPVGVIFPLAPCLGLTGDGFPPYPLCLCPRLV